MRGRWARRCGIAIVATLVVCSCSGSSNAGDVRSIGACPRGAQTDSPPLLTVLDEVESWFAVGSWRITGAKVKPPTNNSRPVEATMRRLPDASTYETVQMFTHDQIARDISVAVSAHAESVVVGVRKTPKFAESAPYVSVGYVVVADGALYFAGLCQRQRSFALNDLAARASTTPGMLMRDYIVTGSQSALAQALVGR